MPGGPALTAKTRPSSQTRPSSVRTVWRLVRLLGGIGATIVAGTFLEGVVVGISSAAGEWSVVSAQAVGGVVLATGFGATYAWLFGRRSAASGPSHFGAGTAFAGAMLFSSLLVLVPFAVSDFWDFRVGG